MAITLEIYLQRFVSEENILDSQRVAEVLEDAARLYRDEKVEWCRNKWIQFDQSVNMSMCAEGALMKALGWNIIEIGLYQAGQQGDSPSPKQLNEFWQVNRIVAQAATKNPLIQNVHEWNDDGATCKQDVIDLFENTAKDLRNGAGGLMR